MSLLKRVCRGSFLVLTFPVEIINGVSLYSGKISRSLLFIADSVEEFVYIMHVFRTDGKFWQTKFTFLVYLTGQI